MINVFLAYLILLSFSTITSDTYSYFIQSTEYSGKITNSESFCKDNEYKKTHRELCNDNSEIGNNEQIEQDSGGRGDGDTPGHQDKYCPEGNCNDHNNGNGSEKKEGKEKGNADGIGNTEESNNNEQSKSALEFPSTQVEKSEEKNPIKEQVIENSQNTERP